MTLTAGIYDPYLDTLGGGERYCLTVAEILLKHGYNVDLFWSGETNLIARAEERFDLNLKGLNIVPDIFSPETEKIDTIQDSESVIKVSHHRHQSQNKIVRIKQFFNKYQVTRKYDVFFYLSDWSVPFLFSKKNLLHVQLPLLIKLTFKDKVLNLIKTLFFSKIICNSNFTSKIAKKYFGNKCLVIYPPVDVLKFDISPKKNQIISVGRFDNIMNSKKQDVLIDSFKQICQQQKNTSWRLILAGGSLADPEKNSYLQHLKHLAQDLPVDFIVNPDFLQLKSLYSSSKIYWHAAGYGVDEVVHPENTEHFGIAPVEAMASGCVPVLVNQGGLPEIVTEGQNGYLWKTTDQLIAKTQLLMGSDQITNELSAKAKTRSVEFSKENFEKSLKKIISSI